MSIVTQENFDEEITTLLNNLVDDSSVIIDIESNGTELFSNQQLCGVGIGIPTKKTSFNITPLDINILKVKTWITTNY